jgi:hypothetical protein
MGLPRKEEATASCGKLLREESPRDLSNWTATVIRELGDVSQSPHIPAQARHCATLSDEFGLLEITSS